MLRNVYLLFYNNVGTHTEIKYFTEKLAFFVEGR